MNPGGYGGSVKLSGKVALITGAASGIGSACAALFKREGALVAGIDMNDEGLAGLGPVLDFAAQLDVTDRNAVDATVQAVVAELGKIDILVNCAGITLRHVPEDLEWEERWQRVMDVNVKGTLHMCRAVMAECERQGAGGSIINLSSIYGHVSRPPDFVGEPDPYSHSKATILQVTRDLAMSGAASGIRVNALCPGFIETPLISKLKADPEKHRRLIALHPLGRLGQPEEVAQCALFLASDDSSFVTGTSLAVDGGYLAV